MSYKKTNPRITVKYINNDTEEVMFELNDRSHMNVGELFTDYIGNSIIEGELGKLKIAPDEIMVIAVGVFKKM